MDGGLLRPSLQYPSNEKVSCSNEKVSRSIDKISRLNVKVSRSNEKLSRSNEKLSRRTIDPWFTYSVWLSGQLITCVLNSCSTVK